MIFVTLGTQDKSFDRLLKAIDKEIKNGNIKEEVIVQAGFTKYKSKNMKIIDLIEMDEFNRLIKEANLIITHGGVGSILSALENNKKVIACARLKKYKEHTNDHQIQIVSKLTESGYILELDDNNKLDEVLKEMKTFKPKKYESNTDKFISLIEDYIEKEDNTSWLNKYFKVLRVLFVIIILVIIGLIVIKTCLK